MDINTKKELDNLSVQLSEIKTNIERLVESSKSEDISISEVFFSLGCTYTRINNVYYKLTDILELPKL